jgi:phosphoglycerate dehydrogenase-like enzyme
MRIVLCYPVKPCHVEQIQAAAPEAEVVPTPQTGEGMERVAREILAADVFCGHAKVPMPWDEVVAQDRLRWIQSSAAGMDHCLVPSVIESDITVTSASGVLADQVAEQTLALLLGVLRNLPTFFRAQQARDYTRRPTRDLHRATIGIVGLGGNGRRLVEVLAPFRVRILATDMFPVDKPESVEHLWPPEKLSDMLSQVDILILAAPLTDLTRDMINRSTLAQMKPGSVLINVARGPLVVEEDLAAALESGHLSGAGIDVAAVEPLPADSPLWEQPNLIITPHVGGQSAWRIDQMTDLFCENLRRDRAGEVPLNLLADKRLGFPIPTDAMRDSRIPPN